MDDYLHKIEFIEKQFLESSQNKDYNLKQLSGAIPILENFGIPVGLYVNPVKPEFPTTSAGLKSYYPTLPSQLLKSDLNNEFKGGKNMNTVIDVLETNIHKLKYCNNHIFDTLFENVSDNKKNKKTRKKYFS